MTKAMPDKRQPNRKSSREIYKHTEAKRGTETSDHHSNTFRKLPANETKPPYSRLVAMFNAW